MQSCITCELGRKNGFLRPRKAKCMMTGEIKIPGPGQKGMLYIRYNECPEGCEKEHNAKIPQDNE